MRNERQAGRAPASAVIETLQSPVAVAGLTLNVAAVPFRGTGSKAAVGVVVHASGSDMQTAEAAGRFNGSVDVAIAAAGADGKVKDSERGTLRLQLKPETREHIAQHGIRLLSQLDLPPEPTSSGSPRSTTRARPAAACDTTSTCPTSRKPGCR